MTQKGDLAALFGATDASTFFGLATSLTHHNASSASGRSMRNPYAAASASGGPDSIRRGGASLNANLDRYNFDLVVPFSQLAQDWPVMLVIWTGAIVILVLIAPGLHQQSNISWHVSLFLF